MRQNAAAFFDGLSWDNLIAKLTLNYAKRRFSDAAIRYYAEVFNIHPGIIVGRLQHKKYISFTAHSHLIEKIELLN